MKGNLSPSELSHGGRENERSGCDRNNGAMGMSSWRVRGLSEGSSCHSVPVLVPRADAGLMLPDLQFFCEKPENSEYF